MKLFHGESDSSEFSLTNDVIEVSVQVMRRIRAQLREGNADGLSFTHARSLGCIHQTPGLSVTDVSIYLGLQAPTTSKAVDDLVELGLVHRETAVHDRRRTTLRLTKGGEAALERAIGPARRSLADRFAPLNEEDREVVRRAMALLLPLLDPASRPAEEVGAE